MILPQQTCFSGQTRLKTQVFFDRLKPYLIQLKQYFPLVVFFVFTRLPTFYPPPLASALEVHQAQVQHKKQPWLDIRNKASKKWKCLFNKYERNLQHRLAVVFKNRLE